MAIESRKKDRVFVSGKETTAFTPNTTNFTEMLTATITKPEPDWMIEFNSDKIGTDEMGTSGQLQSVSTPFTITAQRLSEVAFFMSYALGTDDSLSNVSGSAYLHRLNPLAVNSLTLPTFTMEYGTGTSNTVISGCVINDFSLTLSVDGNGVIDFTANGWGAQHYDNSGTITERDAGSMSSAVNDFSSEPLVNMKSTCVWLGDELGTGGIRDFSISPIGADAPNYTDISTLINSITITYSNGKSATDSVRACGGGVPSDNTRGNREMTLEMNLRKDDALIDTDALIRANTAKSVEIGFVGPEIASTYPYALNMFFPKTQIESGPEDDETPISRTVTYKVLGSQDSDNTYDFFIAWVQSILASGYNA